MLERKKASEEANSKPKFLSKEERARLAIERRTREVAAKRAEEAARLGALRKTHGVNSDNSDVPDGWDSTSKGSLRRSSADDHPMNGSEDSLKRGAADKEDLEMASMRARYMGLAPQKNKKRRLNDRKFIFDWSTDSDTSTLAKNEEIKPINVGYGRGHLGGFESKNSRRGGLDKHWRDKDLSEMTERDWRIFREDYNIATKGLLTFSKTTALTEGVGGSVPPPLRNWEEANLPRTMMSVIRDVNYKEPTPIQRQAIPIGLKCRDIIGIAETGSGKTAAFIIPILVYIQTLPPIEDSTKNDGPYAIVLAPTRELAQQIEHEAQRFARPMGFTVVSIVGGHSLEEQVQSLTNGAEIVIATPGRLVDCLEKHVLVLSQCNYVVMDEADRMIDMGFEEDVQKVLDALPLSNVKPDTDEAENPELMGRMLRLGNKRMRYRQTVMFSATMPSQLERLARQYMRRPATVIVGNAGQAVDTVEQRVVMVTADENKRKRLLEDILSEQEEAPIIVFVREKRNCEVLARDLKSWGWKAVTLYGSKSQDQREAALNDLREKRADALVATDLAGRGLDVPDVKLVVNYNMAKTIEGTPTYFSVTF